MVLTMVMLVSVASCGKGGKIAEVSGANTSEVVSNALTDTTTDTAIQNSGTMQNTQEQSSAGTVTEADGSNTSDLQKTELLQSASVDLDSDGVNEQVDAVMASTPGEGQDSNNIQEGILVIRDNGSEKKVVFNKREQGLTSLLTSMQFEDLDSDGSKEVFIIIPDHGASFSYSTYFVYSYKKDKSYSFTVDNSIIDYIAGFHISYKKGANKLTFTNSNYDFEADLSIESDNQKPSEETMQEYASRAWIDPTAIDISDDSRLALVKSPDGRSMEIKVPLPVFGMATVDMIGEIDSFYTLDDNLEPVLRHFDMWDFAGANPAELVKVGSCNTVK